MGILIKLDIKLILRSGGNHYIINSEAAVGVGGRIADKSELDDNALTERFRDHFDFLPDEITVDRSHFQLEDAPEGGEALPIQKADLRPVTFNICVTIRREGQHCSFDPGQINYGTTQGDV